MALHQSGEDYLEAILALEEEKGSVRSIDVARHLGYSKPSVSRAMANLKASGHIVVEEDGRLKLTEEGQRVAKEIYERHKLLTEWLVGLGVDKEIAAEDACRIEHVISQESFDSLRRHVQEHLMPNLNPNKGE